uniref:ADAM metallopeptidase with thrombospondin type 1 motif 7 n=1 Tax=Callorhinchus milii TaxID=7868 RepID=A0A4W3JK28_CALMI
MPGLWCWKIKHLFQTLTTFIAFLLVAVAHDRTHRDLGTSSEGAQLSALPGSELVYPVRVNEVGHFLSHDVSHHLRRLHRRDLGPDHLQPPLLYRLRHSGRDLSFNLTVNRALLAPGFVAERRYGGIKGASISPLRLNTCHFIGRVTDQEQHSGVAAISTCHGMKGVFRLWGEDHFIEPWLEQALEGGSPQPHLIYKRHAPGTKTSRLDSLRKQEHSEKQREKWEKRQRRRRRIKQRSVSKEKWVETLVVADSKMVEHHGNESIEAYVLTVMNMVAGLFRDASIGNSINIVIVRLVLLEEDEDLKITHHADNTLMNFCKWQKKMNIKGEAHPTHHDVAILLTRKDICAGMNRPCETLGLSHVSGMCQPHRSCNINEDSGLPLAFTVAHELGHNFGIQHDGTGNACEPIGKRPFIMSPQLLYDTSPLTWSRCSQEYITRFLDRGWGLCLDDLPAKEAMELPSVPPGVLYDVNHQCRLQYGARSGFCDDMDNVCNTLWCTVGSTCHSKLDAAVDGTKCSEDKWCFNGNCISTVQRPKSTDGSWGAWSSWAECTRTCSAGIQSAERHCNNPTPKYGGRYCLGERKRFRICNIKACVTETPSFRHIQCSQFDSMPYKGKLHKWIPVLNRINPCELHCRPVDGYFSEKMLDAVIDGTPCNEGNTSRDICINGICKNVGCDYEIDSNALEDRCGVCQGDSSTCETVKKTFDESEGLGYVDIGLIPQGAREIRIEEVAEAGNFLALRSDDPEKYFLNGDWIIQWNGDYKVAGTTFTYERNGNLENLTSPGPTKEPVWIQLLFQETNPGVRFEYTIRRDLDSDNEIQPPEFFWRYGLWTECTATCGGGFQKQIVHCLERIAGIVEEQYCDPATRPDDRRRRCHEEPCPARWWVGEWQACSTSCGHTGVMKRTALCIQSIGLDEQRALPISECQHMPRPDTASTCNTNIPCPSDWVVGNWSQCSASCGEGTQKRAVRCAHNTAAPCSPEARPPGKAMCAPRPCPAPRPGQDPALPEWSGSGASAKELFNEVGFNLNFGPGRTGQGHNSNRIPGSGPQLCLCAIAVQCSTTCGMGAVWRAVQCSTGSEADCDRAQRPAPARRCYLRPCSAWRLGNWTKCSKNCGVGVKLRDVQCINIRDRRPLRPFHCQPVLHKPPTRLLSLFPHPMAQCSQGCDGGEQERLVLCPEVNHCDRATRPNKTRTCNPQPCTKWMMGSWGQCTVTCGGGIQRRLVKCVNTVTGLSEEDNSRCDHEPWPENSQKCNLQDCSTSYVCDRDRLTFSFCQTLRMLGRCYLHTVRAQCCQTCRPPAHATRDRGNERVARR